MFQNIFMENIGKTRWKFAPVDLEKLAKHFPRLNFSQFQQRNIEEINSKCKICGILCNF